MDTFVSSGVFGPFFVDVSNLMIDIEVVSCISKLTEHLFFFFFGWILMIERSVFGFSGVGWKYIVRVLQ